MKTYFIALLFILSPLLLFAQVPEKISYQAVVRDANNDLVINKAVGVQISILQESVSGTAVYVERHTPTSNGNGLISLEIGTGTTTTGTFASIDWANNTFFIKTEIDPNGGTSYTISGVSQLLSVPYALHAKTAESLVGGGAEADPIFSSSVAAGVTGADTANWNSKVGTEVDPVFSSSVAAGVTESDTANWNSKVGTEVDPVFSSSVAAGVTESDTANWNSKVGTEVDPVFSSSVAAGVTDTDTANWNSKVGTEVDPVFSSSVAAGVTDTDTANWNSKVGTEVDPVFSSSVAAGVTDTDTANWNSKVGTEVDPVFSSSVAAGVTDTDTANWNSKVGTEVDPVFSSSVAAGISEDDTMRWNDLGGWNSTETTVSTLKNVAIGRNTTGFRLSVQDTLTTETISTFINTTEDNSGLSFTSGLWSQISATTSGNNYAATGLSYGENDGWNIGVIGTAFNANTNAGVVANARRLNENSNGFNYGLNAGARNATFSNIAVGAYAELADSDAMTNYGIVARANSTTTTGVNYGIFAQASNGATNYAGYFSGDVTITGTLSTPSDGRLKSNVQPMGGALQLVSKLQPVSYNYLQSGDAGKLHLPQEMQYGLIAQELEEVLPHLVVTNKYIAGTTGGNNDSMVDEVAMDGSGVKNASVGKSTSKPNVKTIEYKSINYIGLVPVLVQSIKEQQKTITTLEKRLELLEERLKKLEE